MFKNYNLKYILKNKSALFFNITAIAVGLAVMLTIQVLILVNESNLDSLSHVKIGGDIGVILSDRTIDNEQLEAIEEYVADGYMEYTTSIWKETVVDAGKRQTNCMIRFIDSNIYPFYKLREDSNNYKFLQTGDNVILSNNLANRLSVDVGDQINIQDIDNSSIHSYHVVGISPDDGETSFDMNINGYIFMDKNQIEGVQVDEIRKIANKIYLKGNNAFNFEHIIPIFKGDTVEIFDEVKNEVYKEIESTKTAYSAMGIISIIMASIGILSSMILMIIKRRKDICIFKVFGANNKQIIVLFFKEVLLMSLLGSFIGVLFGLILSFFVYQVTFSHWYNILLIPGVLGNMNKTFLLGICASSIFGLIPVVLTIQFQPIVILRNQDTAKINVKRIVLPCLISFALSGIVFSIFLGELSGFLIISLAILVFGILYLLALISFKLVSLPIAIFNKVKVIATKSIRRDAKKFSIVVLTMSISVAVIGLVLLMGNSILPSLKEQVENSLGYDVFFKANISLEQEVEQALVQRDNVTVFYKSSRLESRLIKINDITINSSVNSSITEITMDCIHGDLGYINDKIIIGDLLDEDSTGQIILDQKYMEESKISVGDKISLLIGEKLVDFKVIGVRHSEKIKTGQAFINYKSVADISNNNSFRYYVDLKENDSDEFIQYMNEKFDNIVVMDMGDVALPYATTLNKQMHMFKIIAPLCIISAVFLVFNILTVTYLGKKKEFAILKLFGAGRLRVIELLLYQGLMVGTATVIVAFLICVVEATLLEGFTGIIINIDVITIIEIVLLSIGLSELSIVMISYRIVDEDCNSIIRAEQ